MLGEVKLDLRTAYHAEILFGNITGGHSAVDTHQVVLADSGREAYAIQVDAAVDAHGKLWRCSPICTLAGKAHVPAKSAVPIIVFSFISSIANLL